MIKLITSVKVKDRRVIVRTGFDVPLAKDKSGALIVADDTRIKDAMPTLRYLIDGQAKIIIISHLGRPESWDKDKSNWPVALKLGELLDRKVVKISDKLPEYRVPHIYFLESDITKKNYSKLSEQIKPGDILFLENLRFFKGEQENGAKFVETLAKFGDVFVQEAFPAAHRKSASNFGLAYKLPRYAGIAFMNEITSLGRILRHPNQPMVVIMGGAKIDDKVGTLNNLAAHAHQIILGGAIANTFLKALGYDLGKSQISDIKVAKQILRHYREKIILPIDAVVADSLDGTPKVVKIDKVRPEDSIYDIGPESVRKFDAIIKTGKTLVWNGPFGIFEKPKFAFGSRAIARAFASKSRGPAYGVVGGGETVELVNQTHLAGYVDHLSTGGGAMLEFLAGKKLPAITALES